MGISFSVLLTFFGGLAMAVGTFLTTVNSHEKQEMLEAELREKDQIIIQKSSKIEELSEEIIQSVTGGDAFAQAMFYNSGSDQITLSVMNDTQYPLYDLQVTVFDQDNFKKELAKYSSDEEKAKYIPVIHETSEKVFKIGNLGAMQIKEIGHYHFNRKDGERSFRITFLARNGQVNQSMMIRGGKYATRVISKDGLLFEQIDPGFPVDELWSDREEWLARKVVRKNEDRPIKAFSVVK